MALFTDYQGNIPASWLNSINTFFTSLFQSATTAAQARAALGLGPTAALPATASVAAHATTCDVWTAWETVLTGGAVTFTDIADAPYAGAVAWVRMNAAHIWTQGATFTVRGGATYTTASGDWVRIRATTTSTFDVTIFPVSNASETVIGMLELATGAEALAGTDTTRAVTSAGLASGKSLGTAGYMKLPGGLIIQWGTSSFTATDGDNGSLLTFPLAFPTTAVQVVATSDGVSGSGGGNYMSGVGNLSNTNCRIWSRNAAGTYTNSAGPFIAIGY